MYHFIYRTSQRKPLKGDFYKVGFLGKTATTTGFFALNVFLYSHHFKNSLYFLFTAVPCLFTFLLFFSQNRFLAITFIFENTESSFVVFQEDKRMRKVLKQQIFIPDSFLLQKNKQIEEIISITCYIALLLNAGAVAMTTKGGVGEGYLR